jgi:hypothetical protein
MSARRCPHCGGLVAADLEWCGQCLNRLSTTPAGRGASDGTPSLNGDARPPAVQRSHLGGAADAVGRPAGATAPRPSGMQTPDVRVEEGRIVWVCPVCSGENPMETQRCVTCGTPFGRLFQEPGPASRVTPRGAAGLSLLFPGVGHIAGRRVADGVARAVVFAFTLTMFVSILVSARGTFGPLLLMFGLAAGLIYGATPMDAARAVRGEPPVLTTRMLLIGATAMLGLATVVLVVGGSRLAPG